MKILLCTDGSAYAQISYEYAAWLAMQMEVEIEVLYVTDKRKEQASKTKDFSGTIGVDAYQDLLAKLVERESEIAKINHQRAKIILQEAKSFLESREIDKIKLTHETGFLVDLFHKLEENSDLIILGKRGETANFATEHLGANIERIVRSSHKPCLITPRRYQPINKIVLAYDGSKSCQKAVANLGRLSTFKNIEVHIISVARKNDSKIDRQLKDVEGQVVNSGLKPICHLLNGDPELEIEKYIESNDINLLIMGAYGHNRIRRLLIGSTTLHLLRNTQIPILVVR